MEEEKKQQATSTETSIALLQKDVTYILDSVKKIDLKMDVYEKTFARKEELTIIQKAIEKQLAEIKVELDKKVDHSDFDPIKKTLARINWLVISAVIVGLLALIIKTR